MLVWTAFGLAVAVFFLLRFRRCRHKTTTTITTNTRAYSSSSSLGRLPPGPPGWPVVGNLLDLGTKPQETFLSLQRKYGPLFMLRLGTLNTLVITSTDVAMELFKKHDHSFCNRHLNEALQLGEAYTGAMGVRPYGPYWRMMRRLCATEFFSKKKINETSAIRRRCVDKMVQWISSEAKENHTEEAAGHGIGGVELVHFVYASFFNLMGNLLFSKDLMDPKSGTGSEFFHLTCELVETAVKPNVADFFPWLRRLDPQNIKKKMEEKIERSLDIVDSFVKERRSMDTVQRQHNKEKDFWDVLMEFEGNGKDEPKKISDRNINLLIHVSTNIETYLKLI